MGSRSRAWDPVELVVAVGQIALTVLVVRLVRELVRK